LREPSFSCIIFRFRTTTKEFLAERLPLVSQTIPDQLHTGVVTPPWSLATRIAFRFCFVYFSLYCLSTQIITSFLSIPDIGWLSDPSVIPPWREITTFTAAHILRIKSPLTFVETGSGDRTIDWVLVFALFSISVVATLVWSVLDRRRQSYSTLHKWFFLFLRFALAGQMLTYGFVKAIPMQMPAPLLTKLTEPFGDLSPMGVLWSSVGASPPYEIAVGCLELIGGLLLFVPRAATLGALIAFLDMSYVFLLNMTYDVPVKLLSFHLILISLVLLAPQARRLVGFFLLDRAVEPAPKNPLFRTLRANRIALAVQAVFALWLIGINLYSARTDWRTFGGGAPKPALYGIWNVDQFTTDGQPRPPLLSDPVRWRRIIFDRYDLAALDRMTDPRAFYSTAFDEKKNTLALTQRRGGKQNLSFSITRPAPDRLTLDGPIDGHKTHIELRLDTDHTFLLKTRGFHWISEGPFNR
jgi:uncharacterized membrane protein YphA (DoxX/SURF4 family)